jgi:hypothetical protein
MKQFDRPPSKPEGDADSPTIQKRAWPVVRIVLGQCQMIGAIVSFCLLLEIAVNGLSLGMVVVTCLLT